MVSQSKPASFRFIAPPCRKLWVEMLAGRIPKAGATAFNALAMCERRRGEPSANKKNGVLASKCLLSRHLMYLRNVATQHSGSSGTATTSLESKVQYGPNTGHFCSIRPYPSASILADGRLYWHCQYAKIESSETWAMPQRRYWDTFPVLYCKEMQLR